MKSTESDPKHVTTDSDSESFRGQIPANPLALALSSSYGNPSSSSVLSGRLINQHLHETQAGAKDQRGKLAAVFSSAFMLAAGWITKCAIRLISALKQTPQQGWEGLFALAYILLHWILVCEGGMRRRTGWDGGGGTGGGTGGLTSVLFCVSVRFLSVFSSSTYAAFTLLSWHFWGTLEK